MAKVLEDYSDSLICGRQKITYFPLGERGRGWSGGPSLTPVRLVHGIRALSLCEHAFVTSQGSTHGRFERAIANQHLGHALIPAKAARGTVARRCALAVPAVRRGCSGTVLAGSCPVARPLRVEGEGAFARGVPACSSCAGAAAGGAGDRVTDATRAC